jgi:hypothetical protein
MESDFLPAVPGLAEKAVQFLQKRRALDAREQPELSSDLRVFLGG